MTISTKQYNITIEAGADFSFPFSVRDDSEVLVDLTGATVTAQLREYAEASDYFQFTATHNGQGGRITLSMPHEDTAQIAYTEGVYDVFIEFPNTTVEKYMEGVVTITPSVTKPVNGDIMYLLSFDSESYFPSTGMARRLYLSHASSKLYRWNGTGYVGIDQGTYTREEIDAMLEEKSDIHHIHDDRYYTEDEANTLLAGKSNVGHNHDASYSPLGHDHDDRYYTESEIDDALSAKANTADLGDLAEKDTVDWDSDITNIPEDFPPSEHDHDDRYYTESEMDTLLSAKADSADLGDLASKDTVDYETDIDNLPTLGALAAKDTVDWDTDIDDIPSTFPPSTHTHTTSDITDFPTLGTMSAESASDYYTKTATDALLSEKADIIHTSASGALVHLTDAGAYPVDALTVGIEPVQDLHGYDAPWPAGGGSNIWDEEWEVGGISSNTGLNAVDNTIIRSKNYIPISESTNYFFVVGSVTGSVLNARSRYYDADKNYIGTGTFVYFNSQFTTPTNAAYMRFALQVEYGTTYKNDIAINYPSTVTTYSPYSNICPISGHSTAVVTRTGVNIWDEEWEVGIIDTATGANSENSNCIRSKNYISVVPSQNYYLVGYNGTSGIYGVFFYGADKSYLGYTEAQNLTGNILAVPSNCHYIRFRNYAAYGTTYGNNISINYPSSDTAYHAHNIQTLTIDLDGTRYGGQLNVLTGEMTVTKVIETLTSVDYYVNGKRFQKATSNIAKYNLANTYCIADRILCSYYGTVEGANNATQITGFVWTNNAGTSSLFFVTMPDFTNITTKSQMDAWLASNPITFVYELATPFTIQLSPATLSLLLGENNIWADTGDTSVGYRANTKLYIDSKLASAVAELQALILDN